MGNVALGVTSPGSMMEVDIQSVASDVFTCLGSHGFAAGDYVVLGGEYASLGATSSTRQGYVIASGLTATAFKLSATYGGSAATFTDANPARVWAKPSILRRGTNLQVTLAEDLDDSETDITLTTGHGARLPSAPFVLVIQGPTDAGPTERWERVLVTVKSTDTLTVTRGYEGTTATAHSTGRTAWVRSIAPAANCLAQLDWREATIRDALATGTLAASVDPSSDDQTTTGKGFVARANTLFAVTGTGTTLTVTGTHGLVVGDRFCFMAKAGGSNVRMGHTYYVTGTSGGLQFAEEKHGSTYTTDITLATDITSGVIRVFTRSGTQVFDYRTSLYPKMWGLMYAWAGGNEWDRGTFDCVTLNAREYFDPLTLRGTQAFIHMLSVTDNWEPSDRKHYGQAVTFHKDTTNGGTFTLTADGQTTAAITFSRTFATLKSNIRAALLAIGLTNVRVLNNNEYSGSTLKSYGVQITFSGSRTGITGKDFSSLTGSTAATITGPIPLVKAASRAQFSARLAKLGEQIAAMGNDKLGTKPNVLIRMDYEFNTPHMIWTAFPDNGGTDAQQLAYDANGSERAAPWKRKWDTMSVAIKTTGGATNAKTVWCVLDSKNPSSYKAAYPSQRPDYTGFDIYTPQAPSDTAGIRRELDARIKGMRTAVGDRPIIIAEFGHRVTGTIADPIPVEGFADPDGNSALLSAPSGALRSGEPVDHSVASISSRDAWFKAFMERLYARSEVHGVLYYDLAMAERGQKRNWSMDGSPSLVACFAAQTRLPKNRRQL